MKSAERAEVRKRIGIVQLRLAVAFFFWYFIYLLILISLLSSQGQGRWAKWGERTGVRVADLADDREVGRDQHLPVVAVQSLLDHGEVVLAQPPTHDKYETRRDTRHTRDDTKRLL